jgi:transcriptional regulator with XRE-family HTH domain
MAKPSSSDQIKGLIDALKVLFRHLGFRQADLATQLGISRATLKRRMTGKGLTVVALSQLCAIAGVTLGELYELAHATTDTHLRRLTLAQESAPHADVRLGFVFSRLQLGWTAEEIQRECKIAQAPLVAYLIRLEKLGLIDLLPGNRVRLRTARDIEWRRHGPMWHSVDRYLKDIFDMTDSDDPDLSRRVAVVKLSPASVAQIDEMFHAVQTQVRRLADSDRSVLADDKSWYAMLLGARPFEIDLSAKSELPWWRRKAAKPKRRR